MKIIEKLISLKSKAVDAFYPPRCPVCDEVIAVGTQICPACEKGIKVVSGTTCFKCGKPLNDEDEVFCFDCRKSPKQYERGFAVFEYEYIKESLYRFKYGSRAEYARFYAMKTSKEYGRVLKELKIEALIPVPIHKSRYKKRGYNQAYEYAKELSKITEIPVNDRLISRAKKTRAQKELTPMQRQKNLKKAFKLNVYGVKLQRVCVVDDIYTTGSTINAITLLLKQAGVKEVYFISIAIGRGF